MSDNIHPDIVMQCKKQDKEAQYSFFVFYKDEMFTSLYRLLGNKDDATDALQHGFVTAFQQISNYQLCLPLKKWLKDIMISEILSKIQKRFSLSINERYESTYRPIKKTITGDAIEQIILSLRAAERYCFLLYKVEHYSFEKIAEWLNTTPTICKNLNQVAQIRIKEQLNATTLNFIEN